MSRRANHNSGKGCALYGLSGPEVLVSRSLNYRVPKYLGSLPRYLVGR